MLCAALAAAACGSDDASDSEPGSGSASASASEASASETASAVETDVGEAVEEEVEAGSDADDAAEPDVDGAGDAAGVDEPTGSFPVTIETEYGEVEIPEQPERIVVASATMTGHVLALDAPVVAAQALPGPPLADDTGFMLQWSSVATDAGVEAIPGPEINLEAIAATDPDLILGASFGGDAVTVDAFETLSEIAPTVVLDYSGIDWQELSGVLGEATGRTAEADALVDDFAALVDDVGATIDTSRPVITGVITERGVNMFTDQSAHGRLFLSLGLDLVSPEGGDLEGEAGASTRTDVAAISPELIPDEFGDATVLMVFTTEDQIPGLLDVYPTLGVIPAAEEDRLVALGVESFRLDPYSARVVVERLGAALAG
ncbi:MAG: Fe2+-enterobactin ABC transporter substrate-binding protein [Actinomycetota bacterium]